MKLAVCGDSWFSTDYQHVGRSFGEILANDHDWILTSLARPGISNFGIVLQVDRAIELDSDIIIVNTTTVSRTEIPIEHKKEQSLIGGAYMHDEFVAYQKDLGVNNIDHSDFAGHLLADQAHSSTMLSNQIQSLIFSNDENKKITAEQKLALKHFVSHLYDCGHKRQTDTWIISDMCRRLIAYGRPWLLFTQSLLNAGFAPPAFFEYAKDLAWIDQKHLVTPGQFSYYRDMQVTDNARFHYCHKTGGSILANFAYERLKEQL